MAVVAVSVVVYGICFVLTRALSRYRELAADRAAALLTGRPSVLAAALTKLSAEMAQIPTQDLRHGLLGFDVGRALVDHGHVLHRPAGAVASQPA